MIPTRNQYRYVTVPDSAEINQQIMPVRGNVDVSLKLEDLLFLEEARCERIAMTGGTATPATIDMTMLKGKLQTLASGMNAVYAPTFVKKMADISDVDNWVPFNLEAGYYNLSLMTRVELMSVLYPNGIYVGTSRSSTATYNDELLLSEVKKIFDDVKDLYAITDLSGDHCEITSRATATFTTYGRSSEPSSDWSPATTYTSTFPPTDWGIGSSTVYARVLYNYEYSTTLIGGYNWYSHERDLTSFSGDIVVSPKTGWGIVGILAIVAVSHRNWDGYNANDRVCLGSWAKSKMFFPDEYGSVTIPCDYVADPSGFVSDLSLVGVNNPSAIQSMPYEGNGCMYEARHAFHLVPIVKPLDFRTDISEPL